jgi:hypothetical protein
LAKVSCKTQKTDRFGREKMAQGMIASVFGATKEMRQALFALDAAQAVGEIDPVPRLLDHVAGEAALQLAFENASGILRADFHQGPDLNNIMGPRPQTGFDGLPFAPFEQMTHAGLGGFHGCFAELSALEEIDVLSRDRGKLLAVVLAAVQMASQEEGCRQEHREENCDNDD